ncbi:MAG: hypothetical protein M0P09_04060, partial [Acholeplasmataceae bacterium]|nr:hypothetical protein [Acholeplasmataceae bacterium]
INRKFSKAYKPISNTKIENILKGYDAFIGSGLTGIMLMRIGPLTCIGHGVRLGKSCFVSQSVTIAGSVAIGNFVKIWGNDSIRDGILVGNGSTNWYGSRCSKKYSEK